MRLIISSISPRLVRRCSLCRHEAGCLAGPTAVPRIALEYKMDKYCISNCDCGAHRGCPVWAGVWCWTVADSV